MATHSRRIAVLITGAMLLAAPEGVNAGDTGALPHYTIVRVAAGSRDGVRRLAPLGVDLEGARLRDTSAVELAVTDREIQKLRDAGYGVEILIADWRAHYRARREADVTASAWQSRSRNFRLGSMGGYLTLAELEAVVDSMHLLYPHLIGTRDSIGVSVEGRTIWGVRMTGLPAGSAGAPRALYTALHHAREPEGMMVLVYFMWYALEQYGVDEEVTAMLNSRELYFVPVINPDGYVYNSVTDPLGGGMWRKNRRLNADGSYGVDINRNYGYKWGFDLYGSNTETSDEAYRGSAPFSEPETRAIRDICSVLKPAVALNYHTHGNVLIHPWGYIDNPTPDSLVFRRLAERLTAHNYYNFGTSTGTIDYVTNGDSDDWMYGDTLAKPRIFAMTPEVGGYDDGFWPLPSRILPIADANLEANFHCALIAGMHPAIVVAATDPTVVDKDQITTFRMANAGLGSSRTTGTLRFASDQVDITSSSHAAVATDETTAVNLTLRPRPGVVDGALATVRVTCDFPGGRSVDSLTVRLGSPITLFDDTASSTSQFWEPSLSGSVATWGYTTRDAFSGSYSYADSPWRDYDPNCSSTFTLRQPLDLSGSGAELRFMARWEIEHEYDFSLVEVSRDSGATWTSLRGKHTRQGSNAKSGKQSPGTWGFDRTSRGWVEERMDLGPALGTRAMLRFRFLSDSYVEADGFYFDDLKVLLYVSAASQVERPSLPDRMRLEQNYPNPFNPTTGIRYGVGVVSREGVVAARVQLAVYDVLGREVAVLVDEQKQPGEYAATWNATGMPSGAYFYRLTAGEFCETRMMLLLR